MDETFRLIRIQARENAARLLTGTHRSAMLGDGLDFAKLRPYQSGDDIRNIAWMTSAKRGELYIKQFESRRKIDVAVAALLDGGVYCAHDNAKQRLIASVAMTLGYAALWQGDRFAGAVLEACDTKHFAPTTEIAAIDAFGDTIHDASLWQTALKEPTVSKRLYQAFTDRSLLCLVGDFFEPIDLALLAQKYEIVVIIVRCKEENDGGFEGSREIVNPKIGTRRKRTVSRRALKAYLKHRQKHDAKLYEHFAHYRVRHTLITDEAMIVSKLIELFSR